MSYTQRKGVITLLYKKGDRADLDNWRPISLLNYDYKICTMALSLRLHKVLDKMISSEQTGYIKGRSFNINRGIRQGCPLSALLFIIAVEMLSVNTKQNKEIKGIEIGNENDLEIKVVQLADDTTLLVKDETSVLKALETISTFCDVSGVRLNKTKTEGIWLSQRESVIDPNVITWSTRPVKSLGIFFGKDIEKCSRLNCSNRLKKLELA